MGFYFYHFEARRENESRRDYKRRKDNWRLQKKISIKSRGNSECPYCGRTMSWCDICQRYSSDCCERYGTCMCS